MAPDKSPVTAQTKSLLLTSKCAGAGACANAPGLQIASPANTSKERIPITLDSTLFLFVTQRF
jgi:hypothetical protein